MVRGMTLICLLSGGNWNDSANAGVWNSNWNNSRTNSNNNVGFRCDRKSSDSLIQRQWKYRDANFLHYAKSTGCVFLVDLRRFENQAHQTKLERMA